MMPRCTLGKTGADGPATPHHSAASSACRLLVWAQSKHTSSRQETAHNGWTQSIKVMRKKTMMMDRLSTTHARYTHAHTKKGLRLCQHPVPLYVHTCLAKEAYRRCASQPAVCKHDADTNTRCTAFHNLPLSKTHSTPSQARISCTTQSGAQTPTTRCTHTSPALPHMLYRITRLAASHSAASKSALQVWTTTTLTAAPQPSTQRGHAQGLGRARWSAVTAQQCKPVHHDRRQVLKLAPRSNSSGTPTPQAQHQ